MEVLLSLCDVLLKRVRIREIPVFKVPVFCKKMGEFFLEAVAELFITKQFFNWIFLCKFHS